MDIDIEKLAMERIQLDLLVQNGMRFTTPLRSFLRFFTKKTERTWHIEQPYLGTLDYLSREFIDMDFSEEQVQSMGLTEAKRLMRINAKRCARVTAIAILNDKWKIRLLTPLLASYLLWRVKPTKLAQLTLIINTISNYADFTNSIRSLSEKRTTIPALMENEPVNLQD